jgi:hypothetical protein
LDAGGNSRDRRKARRLVQSILETYGYSPQTIGEPKKGGQTFWEFFFKYVLPAITITGFGHWVSETSPVLGMIAHVLALMVLSRGLWAWCTTKPQAIVLVIATLAVLLIVVWRDSVWIRKEWTPTFLYLVPTRELIDCERRAFFVNHTGFKGLQNIRIIIRDNKSGSVQENDDFKTGIEPGPQNLDAPLYVWVKPSHPWDEDYTITITGTKFRSVQQMVLRSAKQSAQFALQVTVDPRTKPVMNCRDHLLPDTYSLSKGSKDDCNTLTAIDGELLRKLKPEIYGFQRPNGDFTILKLRKLPLASDLDSQSEDRHLTEYQQIIMRTKLTKYRGTRLLILYAGGPKTLTYASGFRDFFHSLGWRVEGPRFVPVGDEELVDVQVSINNRYWNTPYRPANDLMSALEGIKHRQRYVYDDAVSPDLIVLWVGPKSPNNFKSDDCAPAVLRPKPAEDNTCEMVSQTNTSCPFPPQ